MPDLITHTVGPDGGDDYGSLSEWNSAQARDLVTDDEIALASCLTFSSGLTDDDAFAGWTTDATRYVEIAAAAGHEQDFSARKQGFYLVGSSFVCIRPDSGCDHLRLTDLEYSGTSSNQPMFATSNGGGRGETIITRLTHEGCTGDAISLFQSGDENVSLEQVLIIDPGDDGLDGNGNYNHVTVIGAGNRGIITGPGSAVTNSIAFGSTNDDWSDQGGTHDYNAGGDTTAPGTTTFDSIDETTEFADHAGGDYRTASDADDLNDGGESGTFIGCALEASSGVTLSGSAEGTGSVSGALDAATDLAGSPTGAGSAEGTLAAAASLAGEAAGAGSVEGDIDAAASLAGEASGEGSVSGSLGAAATLSGAPEGAGAAEGILDAAASLAGAPTGAGSVSGTLQTDSEVTLEGEASGAGAFEATILAESFLSASVSGTASISGAIAAAAALAGSPDGATSADGVLAGAATLNGAPSGAGTLSATLVVPGDATEFVGPIHRARYQPIEATATHEPVVARARYQPIADEEAS